MSSQELRPPRGPYARITAGPGQLGAGLYSLLMCALVLTVAGLVGIGAKQPWVFPSLGPTLMLFFETPQSRAARPRDTLVGHGVGILAGLLVLVVFGLRDDPSSVQEGLDGVRVAAAALALGLTTLVLTVAGTPHPPAGATTLIVALGILTTTPQLLTMGAAVVLVTLVGLLINHLLGARQPWW